MNSFKRALSSFLVALMLIVPSLNSAVTFAGGGNKDKAAVVQDSQSSTLKSIAKTTGKSLMWLLLAYSLYTSGQVALFLSRNNVSLLSKVCFGANKALSLHNWIIGKFSGS